MRNDLPEIACRECGRRIGTKGLLNVGPDRATNQYRDSDDPDTVTVDIIGPCGHLYVSVTIPRSETPLPPGIETLPADDLIADKTVVRSVACRCPDHVKTP